MVRAYEKGSGYNYSGKKKVNQLHSVICNRDINFSAHGLLLLAVIRPTLEYGSEVWEANKAQAAALESVVLEGAKRILVGNLWGNVVLDEVPFVILSVFSKHS